MLAENRQRWFERKAKPRAIVDHIQDTKSPSIGESIAEEVHRPALMREIRDKHRLARCSSSPFAALSSFDLQLLFAVDPPSSLLVEVKALTAKQDVNTPIAEARSLSRELEDPLAQTFWLPANRAIVPNGSSESGKIASSTSTESMAVEQVLDYGSTTR